MSVQKFLLIFEVDVEISENFNLMMVLDEKSGDHQSRQNSFSWGHEYLYKFSGKPSNIWTKVAADMTKNDLFLAILQITSFE